MQPHYEFAPNNASSEIIHFQSLRQIWFYNFGTHTVTAKGNQ